MHTSLSNHTITPTKQNVNQKSHKNNKKDIDKIVCETYNSHINNKINTKTNYGCCTCLAQVLQDMGHETEVPVYENNGVLKIPFISIDKEKILEFEK